MSIEGLFVLISLLLFIIGSIAVAVFIVLREIKRLRADGKEALIQLMVKIEGRREVL